MTYRNLSNEKLLEIRNKLLLEYNKYVDDDVTLDMARGKPSSEQLDITENILNVLNKNEDCFSDNGIDCRNYGGLDGILEARRLFADVFNVEPENVLIGGNSSLNMMYDTIVRAYTFGFCDSIRPWSKEEKIKFLCPVPGYDRHFAICELLGIEMINIPMDENGPDMEMVRNLVESDDLIKGIWCVPKYSNPTGVVYSDDVVRAFASLKPAAKDFRIFWDNAYAVHDLYDRVSLLDIIFECDKNNNSNMPIMFASTSKITYPGSGVAIMIASKENLDFIKKQLTIQTIGPDKLNQLRHVKFFGDQDGIYDIMKLHADVLRPKFEVVVNMFEKELGGLGIADWTSPRGGYFISFNSMPGCAKRIYDMCLKAGLTLTNAGATFPYRNDPDDKNIRIAPSYPTVSELKAAVERFIVCVKIVSIDKILSLR